MFSSRSQRDVGGAVQITARRPRVGRTRQLDQPVIALFAAPEVHRDVAFGIEPDDGVRGLVDDPQVVVLVVAHLVRIGDAVDALADLLENWPSAPNSSSCVVAFIQIGPVLALPGWFRTRICPFELTATPRISPRFMSGEILQEAASALCGSCGACCGGTGVGGAGGCCAFAGTSRVAHASAAAASEARQTIESFFTVFLLVSTGDPSVGATL